MALNKDTLNGQIQPKLKTEIISKLNQHLPAPNPVSPEGLTAFNNSREKLASALSESISKIISEEVVKHILDNLEIKGIQVEVPMSTFSQGSGTAVAPNPQPVQLNQSNDGDGLVE